MSDNPVPIIARQEPSRIIFEIWAVCFILQWGCPIKKNMLACLLLKQLLSNDFLYTSALFIYYNKLDCTHTT
jgi:hypothetical protein